VIEAIKKMYQTNRRPASSRGFDFGGTAKINFFVDDKEMLSCDNIKLYRHDFEQSDRPRHC
jgi:hypothetical protein